MHTSHHTALSIGCGSSSSPMLPHVPSKISSEASKCAGIVLIISNALHAGLVLQTPHCIVSSTGRREEDAPC